MNKLIQLVFVLIISLSLKAGVYIEPHIGYNYGFTAESQITSNTNTFSYTAEPGSGIEFGAELGYNFFGLIAGLEYSKASFEVEDKIATRNGFTLSGFTTNKSEVDQSALALVLGYDFPFFFKIYGKYFLNISWDIESDKIVSENSPYNTKLKGSGAALGLAITSIPVIDLFAEYQFIEMDEIDTITLNGSDVKSITSNYKRDRKSFVVGISVPFDL